MQLNIIISDPLNLKSLQITDLLKEEVVLFMDCFSFQIPADVDNPPFHFSNKRRKNKI